MISEPWPLPWSKTDTRIRPGLMSTMTDRRKRQYGMEGVESTSDFQMASAAQESISVPGGKLCSNFHAEVLAINTVAEFLSECGKSLDCVIILTPCPPCKPLTLPIQTSWSRACTPPSPDWQLWQQWLSSGCWSRALHSSLTRLPALTTVALQWVPIQTSWSRACTPPSPDWQLWLPWLSSGCRSRPADSEPDWQLWQQWLSSGCLPMLALWEMNKPVYLPKLAVDRCKQTIL